MTVEADIKTLLGSLCPRVYPDVAPAGVSRPFVTYQQVGGQAITFIGREVPSAQNGRFQVSVWADTRAAAAALALQIENAFILATAFQALPLSAPVAVYEKEGELALYGTRQDFSVTSAR